MGAPPSGYQDRLDIREQIARIERQQEETRKFVDEQHKLATKAMKRGPDLWLAFLIVDGTVIVAVLARLPDYLRILGLER